MVLRICFAKMRFSEQGRVSMERGTCLSLFFGTDPRSVSAVQRYLDLDLSFRLIYGIRYQPRLETWADKYDGAVGRNRPDVRRWAL